MAAWLAGDVAAVFAAVNEAMALPGGATPALLELLGHAFLKSDLPAEAAEAYATAAQLAGDGFAYLKQASAAWAAAGIEEQAFLTALQAQKLVPDDPEIVFTLVKGFQLRGESELLDHFKNRLTSNSNPEHLLLAANLISAETRNPANLPLFKKLLAQHPDDHYTQFKLMAVAREFCDYETVLGQEAWLEGELAAGREWIFEGQTPFANLLHCEDERLNRLATNNIGIKGDPVPAARQIRRAMRHEWGGKIRIGYLSNDFGSTHATMRLARRGLELHDTSRFDVTLYCHSDDSLIARDDGGRAHWGRIVRVVDLDAAETAERVRDDGIDILVDLKGHTGNSRRHALNHPAAPIHIGWLGFPGSTTGVDLDYVIGDRFVLPDSAVPHYHEKFLRMPGSYQPNDDTHRALPGTTSRAELGLPEDAFVFGSFNSNRKITPQTLDLWAEILSRVPGSVLWAMIYHETSRANFGNYLARKGIAAERVIFADAVGYDAHVTRITAADLGLDTFPYNGHTTTSDMLWAGLPVLTKRGTNFASRVSESLLNAAGLPELVAADDRAFVETAVELASNPGRLLRHRQHLCNQRDRLALFDSRKFCHDLERVYEIVIARARSGLEPDHVDL
ncbi:O-linked N-acetylglucosamine transferase family protein [Rhizobium sp. LjRoot254]|uniref:O-linked N-acetylglucosamine transferase, SPINDLY family protein n=1 Tax=Rhizobium sp. LjRoot254 TaxID=3342297 RepID=UPI003ECC6294